MTRATAARCARARPNTFSVGSPLTTSRKWWDSDASAAHLDAAAAAAFRPVSMPNTGTSGSVTSIVNPASGSARATRITTASGTTQASTSWGR